MRKKDKTYRVKNFTASENRDSRTIRLHPALVEGLEAIAKEERKTIGWVAETALARHFGIEVMLRKLKGKAKPAFESHLRIVRRRA